MRCITCPKLSAGSTAFPTPVRRHKGSLWPYRYFVLTNINLGPRNGENLVPSRITSDEPRQSSALEHSIGVIASSYRRLLILCWCVNTIIPNCLAEMKRASAWQLTTPQARCGAIGLSYDQLQPQVPIAPWVESGIMLPFTWRLEPSSHFTVHCDVESGKVKRGVTHSRKFYSSTLPFHDGIRDSPLPDVRIRPSQLTDRCGKAGNLHEALAGGRPRGWWIPQPYTVQSPDGKRLRFLASGC